MSLPSGYKRLEYIQSSGTQYIDTGIIPTNHVDVEVKFQLTESQSVGGIISAEKTWGTAMYSVDAWACRYNTTYKASAFTENVDYTVRVVGKDFYINDALYFTGNKGNFNGGLPLTLFAVNRTDTPNEYSKSKIYYCKIYNNGILVRDYIPCQTTSGEIGLWDDVNSVFYGNAGTGTFTAGPVVITAPQIHAGFTASALSDTTVQLNWAASDGATGYKLYKNGALLSTLTETSYTDTVELLSSTVYAVTAYNDDGESEASTLIYHAVPENPILHLVTDRTAEDVTAHNVKGTYRSDDMNRVGAAMEYVADRLRAAGYDPHISPKTDWKDDDWVDPAAQAVYLGDLAELRKQFTMLESTPRVPPRILATAINSGDGLTYGWANDIEQILMDIDDTLTRLQTSMFYSGELYSGEV